VQKYSLKQGVNFKEMGMINFVLQRITLEDYLRLHSKNPNFKFEVINTILFLI
jgi:hypothetical protein